MPTRYDVTYDEVTSEFTFVDRLPQNVGGQGTIKIKNIETVDYFGPDGPFILDITGTGSGMVAKLYRTPDEDDGSDTLLTTSNSSKFRWEPSHI